MLIVIELFSSCILSALDLRFDLGNCLFPAAITWIIT
jgi:hypothetical protein